MGHELVGEVIRVLVAVDSPIYTQLLVEALKRDPVLDVFSANSEFVVATANAPNIDVLIISSTLDGQANRGFEILLELHISRPQLRTVVLLESSKPEVILEAFRAGARGIISRLDSIESLYKCVHCVHKGQVWANSRQIVTALEALASCPPVRAIDAKTLNLLSKRETEIVRCLAEGFTNREIAERLKLSQHTVKNYLFRIFDKLGASNRVELLFMTLNQTSASQTVLDSSFRNYNEGKLQDLLALAKCEQAAEQGVSMAQLALAQLLWTRRANSKDLIQAYKWFLIASRQISETTEQVSRAMTMEQLIHAEKMASDWLGKTQKLSDSSTQQDQQPSKELGAAAA